MTAQFIIGDTRDVLASMKPTSVDLVFTSPPFLALRSYLPADHPQKDREIGSEATPGEFIDTLLDIVEACDRVLTETGSLVFELGDTYSGSGGAGGDYNEGGIRESAPGFDGSARRSRSGWDRLGKRALQDDQPPNYRKAGTVSESFTANGGPGWPDVKSLCLIPESFRWALVYGRNPFTGRETPRWRVRNVVRWCRPNPPVGALGDKFRPGTSDLAVCCKSKTRWFDLDAVRMPFTGHEGVGTGLRKGQNGDKPTDNRPDDLPTRMNTHEGAPPLDWWEISTQGYAGSHYATFPEKLVVRPVEAMCPREVCRDCGEPRRRIVGPGALDDNEKAARAAARDDERLGMGPINRRHVETRVTEPTNEWSDCGHDNYRRGIVLDPFAGSGTTLAVAEGLGRDSIGIDLDERNADLARERVGMFLVLGEQLPGITP